MTTRYRFIYFYLISCKCGFRLTVTFWMSDLFILVY